MKHLFLLLFLGFMLVSCTKEEVATTPDPIEQTSPFESLLGTWQVETYISGINGVTTDTMPPNSTRVMHIEEDLDMTDYFATGYSQSGENEKRDINIELFPDDQDSIIIRGNSGAGAFCNFKTFNRDSLVIDDSTPEFGIFKTTYVRI